MNVKRVFNKTGLVLALTWGLSAPAWAGSSPATAPVRGTAPTLSSPTNGAEHAVDFRGTYANATVLSTGDTVVMTYRYTDPEGDADDSLSTVVWRYTLNGADVTIPASAVTNVPARNGAPGTSTLIVPVETLGATAIRMEIWERAKLGIPLRGQAIVVADISQPTPGDGTVPPGPVILGPTQTRASGVFLASDNPVAGSGATDYTRTPASHPVVGQTYVFRVWVDNNGNGVWDAGEVAVTPARMQWVLDGTNTEARGTDAAVTLNNQLIEGATTDSYTVPVNNASGSGATPGDQGFTLKVDFD